MAGADDHLRLVLIFRVVERLVVAGFEQQAAADRRRPSSLRDVLSRLRLGETRLGRDRAGEVRVPADLVGPVEHRRELVLRRDLRREPAHERFDVVVVDGLRAVGVDGATDVVVVGPVAAGEEQPEAILLQGAADGVVEVVLPVQLRGQRKAAGGQIGVGVLAREVRVREVADELDVGLVAAGSRNPVHQDARQLVFRGTAADLHGDFLRLRLVVVHARALPAREHRVGHHAVDERPRIGGERAVHRQAPAHPHRRRTADVVLPRQDRGDRAGHRHVVAPGRQRLEQLVGDHFAPLTRLHVDDRRLAGDGDALFDVADGELDIERRHEVRFEHDALTDGRAEAGERERHPVGARPEIDETVLAGFVRDGGAGFFDQRRTAGFDSDAGQYSAAGVADDARDGALTGRLREQRRRYR